MILYANFEKYPDLLDQMFQLRARIFFDKLHWDVKVSDGRERDKYDEANPVYVLYVNKAGKVLASLRLLPTTGPTLFRDVFFTRDIVNEKVWECTKLCFDESLINKQQRNALIIAAVALLTELEVITEQLHIETLIGNFNTAMLRLYRYIGCKVTVLGSTERYGDVIYAGAFPISAQVINRIKDRLANLQQTITIMNTIPRQLRRIIFPLVLVFITLSRFLWVVI